jgi:hypothetical protein
LMIRPEERWRDASQASFACQKSVSRGEFCAV